MDLPEPLRPSIATTMTSELFGKASMTSIASSLGDFRTSAIVARRCFVGGVGSGDTSCWLSTFLWWERRLMSECGGEIEVTAGAPLAVEVFRGSFEAFFSVAEPRLRRALIARFGPEAGREATVEALVYGWRHWERVRSMSNPLGYLYRVGTSVRKPGVLNSRLDADVVGRDRDPLVEPGLDAALGELSEAQRVCVVLRHSFEWTYLEIAELLEISVSSLRNHLDRGLGKLRARLEVDHV